MTATTASSSLAQVALVVANQLRTKLDLDHARQVITISRGLRRLGRLVVDRVKYTYLGIKPSFSHRPGTSLREAAGGVSECPRTVTGGIRGLMPPVRLVELGLYSESANRSEVAAPRKRGARHSPSLAWALEVGRSSAGVLAARPRAWGWWEAPRHVSSSKRLEQ